MATQQLTKNTGSAWGDHKEPTPLNDVYIRRKRTLEELPDAPEKPSSSFTVKLRDSFEEDDYDEDSDEENEEDF